ncbi:MAG TPA: SPOR domain-containing protein [Bryobacteraceae bacterium]|nr:SPOR domain-containing protein [Bryobacteraceae bacterium]HOL72502.1 SPOR domain-containing protein [Bryobacteraceae bacterium]HOQ45417.1 SPOR domain-containing protein [Bryobacteraceae bacterium]HPQ14627.1 SPOR domain-containing protein [Bryobacteraceae bacterium]HPU73942.1 SPOR domain-containing protein [Bryobacteraceae bacterium]
MPKNEEGEFELVVGNRQLLTIVFIMMVLFGIVFTMGYLVGKAGSPEKPAMAAVQGQPADVVAQRPGPSAPLPATESTAVPELPPEGEAKAPVGTVPVREAPAASVTEAPAPQPAETAQKSADSLPPAPGQTFLQVGAVKKPDAEVIVDVLKKRGFSARIAPVVAGQPDDALWRVLVGPLPDAATLAKTRADLQNAGFSVIVRKY